MRTQVLLVLLLAVLVSSCSKNEKKSEPDVKTYDLHGTVIAIDRQQHEVTIDHEAIPGYMMAMAMPFRVKDTTLMTGVEPGDSVLGTLAVSKTDSWLQSLFVLGKATRHEQSAGQSTPPVHQLQVGEKFPDFSFVNQDGRRVRMSDFDGQVVALTFVYTRCPLPNFCVQMTEYFSNVQQALADDASLRNQWHLVSISFDPSYDTPSVLASYGRAYHADFRNWDFMTDSLDVIMSLARSFGLVVQDQGNGTIIHNLRTVVLNPDRTIAAILSGNDWKVEELESLMRRLIRENS